MHKEELEERKLEFGRTALAALLEIQAHGMDSWVTAVRVLGDLGHQAEALLADYYDAMTPEEIDADFEEGEQVSISTPSEGVRVGFTCSLTRPELAKVRRWDDEHYTGDVLRDAALAYIHEAEGVRVVLAKVTGREPTRAEILTGLALREAPTQAPSTLS